MFNDLNGMGAPCSGDPGLSGWKIKLLNASGKLVAVTTTDSSGNYSFTNVGPGSYTVEELLQRGWTETWPASPATYSVTTQSGLNQSGLLFGNHQAAVLTPARVIDNGHSGYSLPVTSVRQAQLQGVYGGVGWLDLGTFTIKSGTLTVGLQNLANGNGVEADGVLIVRRSNLDLVDQPTASGPDNSGGSWTGTLENATSGLAALGSSGRNSTRVTLPGVSQPVSLTVQYKQAPHPTGSQSTLAASSAISALDTSSSGGGDPISELAQAFLSSNGKDS